MFDINHYILLITSVLAAITSSKYLLYIFSSPFYNQLRAKIRSKKQLHLKQEIESKIKISAIIPAWNEEVGVLNSVRSLLKSTYDNLEIIVVDDGSTDNTLQILDKFTKNELPHHRLFGKSFKYYSKENGGKGSALNFGIRNSTGDVVVTMDADTIFEPDAIYQVALHFYGEQIDAAVGNVKIANNHNILGLVQQIEYTIGFYFKRTHSVFGSEYIIGGAFGAFKRDIFEKFGYFDENIKTEDIELSTRIQANGGKIIFIEDAIAYTEGPETMQGLMKQRLRWKKGRLDTFKKHKNLFFSRDKKHNKFLTHYLLPITLFYEIELLFEPLLLVIGSIYIYNTLDFRWVILWVVFTFIIHFIAFSFGSRSNSKLALSFTPIYFLLSYILTAVEVYAMYESLRLIIAKRDVVWQKWNRKGITI